MSDTGRPASRPRRAPPPLNAARLEEAALAYVARFATSGGKLGAYLARKLRQRGWDGGDGAEPVAGGEATAAGAGAVAGVLARFADLGYIDDAAWARSRAEGLSRRGLGRRRIVDDLGAAGIGEALRAAALPDEGAARAAALTLARKRRLGPYGAGAADSAGRQKQVAVLLRAGHPLDLARRIVSADTVAELEEWLRENN